MPQTLTIRRKRRTGSGRQDDDAVLVCDQARAGGERDPAERDRDADVTLSSLAARARVRPERLDAEAELVERDGVANAAVDDDSGPAAVPRERRNRVAEQRAAHRAATVDHEYAAFPGLRRLRANVHVVLIAPHGRDRPLEGRRAEAAELDQTDERCVAVLVEQVGRGGHGRRH